MSGSFTTDSDTPFESFARRFARAVAEKRISLVWLGDALRQRGMPVAQSTLTYWRSGARRPEGPRSLAAVAEIEKILGLAPNELSKRIPRSSRTVPTLAEESTTLHGNFDQLMADARIVLDLNDLTQLRSLSIHLVFDIDENGGVSRIIVRQVLQAVRGEATTYLWCGPSDIPGGSAARLTAVSGCRVGTSYTHPKGRLYAALLELEHPIKAPESAVIELAIDFPRPAHRPQGARFGIAHRTRELLFWLRFQDIRVPEWIEIEESNATATHVTTRPVQGRSAHGIHKNYGPAEARIRWPSLGP